MVRAVGSRSFQNGFPGVSKLASGGIMWMFPTITNRTIGIGAAAIVLSWGCSDGVAQSNVWFVDSFSTGLNSGTSWADAWGDMTQIDWEAVQAGDTIYISGGSSGASYSAFETGQSGVPGSPVKIMRSQETDHDGVVTLAAPVQINHDHVLLDGSEFGGIRLTCNTTFTLGSLKVSGSSCTLRNLYFDGNYSAAFGNSMSCFGADLTIEKCYFYKTAFEDFGYWSGQGTLVIRDSYFTMPAIPPDGRHRDGWNPQSEGGYNVLVERCMFTDLFSFLFLMQDPDPVGSMTFNHCLFDDMKTVLRFGSGNGGHGAVQFNNCTFNDCQDTDFSAQVAMRNCLFSGKGPWDPDTVHAGAESISTSLFADGVGEFQGGLGNMVNGKAGYINPDNPLGADGIPFTSDDGFNLRPGSDAINAGAMVPGLTNDIRRQPYEGAPDIGAYEFLASEATNVLAAPLNPRVAVPGS